MNVSLGPPGANPVDTLYVNQTGEVYTTVYPSYVVVTSAVSGETVARLDIGQDVSTLAYDSATNDVIVMSSEADALFAIDASSLRVVSTVDLGHPPIDMVYDHVNGDFLVLVENSRSTPLGTAVGGTVLVLNGTTVSLPLIFTVPTFFIEGSDGPGSGFIGVDTDQQYVYLSGGAGFSGYGEIDWFQLSAPSVNGSIYGTGGGQLAFDPASDNVYVVGGPGYSPGIYSNQIAVLSGTSHNVTAVITPNPAAGIDSMTYDPSAEQLYAASYAATSNSEIYVVSTLNNSVVADYRLTTTCASGLSFDDQSGDIYIADFCGNELQVLSPAMGTLSPIIVGGGGPSGLAYDPHTGDVVVANALANNVSVVSIGSQRVVATVGGMPEPTAVLDDPQTSQVYVIGQGGVVTILDDLNWTIIGGLTLPTPPASPGVGAAYDPVTDQVYISGYNATGISTVYVISGSTHEIVTAVVVPSSDGGPVDALTFDSEDSGIWVGTVFGYVGWISSTNFDVTTVRGGGSYSVLSLAYDGAQSTIYFGSDVYGNETAQGTFIAQGAVIGLNGSTGAITSYTAVGDLPFSLAWSAQTHEMVSANLYESNVSIVNDTTHRVVQNLPVGLAPDGLAYDSLTGSVYVANYLSDNLSLLVPPPLHAITFAEQGLPQGTQWAVSLSGATQNSTSTAISFHEPNGTFAYAITPISGYSTTYNGQVMVNGNNPTVSVTFTQVTYTATFTETGLASGTTWTVEATMSDPDPSWFVNSTGTTAILQLANGTYTYTITAPGYNTVTQAGQTISGTSGHTVAVALTPASSSSPSFLWIWVVIGAVLAVTVIAAVVLLLRRGHSPPRSA